MKSHLKALVAVFVMHVVNDIQSIHIYVRQPAAHIVITLHYLVIIKIFRGDGTVFWSHLLLCDLVHTAVNSIEKAFCKVCAGSEKLHFFSHTHGRYTAGNSIVVSVSHSHQVVILILNG